MTTYYTAPSLYDPFDPFSFSYNDYSIDLSLLNDIGLDGLGICDETENEFPMEAFPFPNIPAFPPALEPTQQRMPTPVPDLLPNSTAPPESSALHDTPISFQSASAVSSPLVQSPHAQITEFKLEPSQDEGKENLSCRVGSPVFNETKIERPMDFDDSEVACRQDENEEGEQGKSTDGFKTGKVNEDSTEIKKEEEISKSDDEFPRNDRPGRCCPSRYDFRRRNGSLHKQSRPTVRKTVVLWKFIKELLDKNDSCVSWISREEQTFKFVDSKQAAKLWGQRKNKRNMTYEKMSRALRYYYDRQIMYHEEGQKLMYRFGDGAREGREERVTNAEDHEEFVADAS